MALTKIGSIGINTGIAFAGVTTIATLNASDNVLSVGGTVNFVSDVSIGGTVSIAGTLTYEDVTNVDAVGLITAQNGIVVGSGITLSKDGDGFFTGVVTATSYAGDGSGLTGIAATDNVRTGILDVAGVGTFRNDVNIPDKIIHLGDTNTAIRFPAADTVSVETGGSERARITSGGQVLIGNTADPSDYNSGADDLIIGSHSSASGITILSPTNNGGFIMFSDNNGGGANAYRGQIEYGHTDDMMRFMTASSERIRFGSSGQLGIAGANYGTSGQVLSSQGSSSAIQWAEPGLIYEGSATSFPGGTGQVDADVILDACRRIEIYYIGFSINSNDGEIKIQLRTGSGTITSGYKGSGHYLSNTSYANSSANSDSFKSYGLGSASASYSGQVVLRNVNSNTWFCNGDFWNDASATGYWMSGHVNAGAALAGVRLSNAAGSYDAGEYKIVQYSTL